MTALARGSLRGADSEWPTEQPPAETAGRPPKRGSVTGSTAALAAQLRSVASKLPGGGGRLARAIAPQHGGGSAEPVGSDEPVAATH